MRDPLTRFTKRGLRRFIVKLEERIEALNAERDAIIARGKSAENAYQELRAQFKEQRGA